MSGTVENHVKQQRTWLAANEQIVERNMTYLLSNLELGTSHAFKKVPRPLTSLGRYFGTLGSLQLVDGDDSGWANIAAATDLAAWSVKVRSESFYRDGPGARGLSNYVNIAASLTCVSNKWRAELLYILRKIDSDPTAVHQPFWTSRKFEPFTLHMHAIADGAAPDSKTLSDPYQGVLDGWDDPDRLAAALEAVCDYHARNMEDDGGDWRAEFDVPPFDLLPCEVMLVQRVRNELGLETPVIDHPLVKVLGTDLPIDDQPEHPVIATLEDAFYKCFY